MGCHQTLIPHISTGNRNSELIIRMRASFRMLYKNMASYPIISKILFLWRHHFRTLLALWMWQTLFTCSLRATGSQCCSWTRGHKANEPCLTICGSFIESWKCLDNCWCEIQAWSETWSENGKLFRGRLSRSKIGQISQDATGSDSYCLAAWLRLLIKRELIELLFAIFFPNFLFKLEAEDVFCNVYPVNKSLIWRKICSECSFVR